MASTDNSRSDESPSSAEHARGSDREAACEDAQTEGPELSGHAPGPVAELGGTSPVGCGCTSQKTEAAQEVPSGPIILLDPPIEAPNYDAEREPADAAGRIDAGGPEAATSSATVLDAVGEATSADLSVVTDAPEGNLSPALPSKTAGDLVLAAETPSPLDDPGQVEKDADPPSEGVTQDLSISDAGNHDPSNRRQGERVGNGDGSIRKYRPRLQRQSIPAPSKKVAALVKDSEPSTGTLEATLLLSFLPGGWGLELSVLLSRADGMPENLDVRTGPSISRRMQSTKSCSSRFTWRRQILSTRASLRKRRTLLFGDGSGLRAICMPFPIGPVFRDLQACRGF